MVFVFAACRAAPGAAGNKKAGAAVTPDEVTLGNPAVFVGGTKDPRLSAPASRPVWLYCSLLP